MCSELTLRARIPDTRIPQLMQPCNLYIRSFQYCDYFIRSARSKAWSIKLPAILNNSGMTGNIVERSNKYHKYRAKPIFLQGKYGTWEAILSRGLWLMCAPGRKGLISKPGNSQSDRSASTQKKVFSNKKETECIIKKILESYSSSLISWCCLMIHGVAVHEVKGVLEEWVKMVSE